MVRKHDPDRFLLSLYAPARARESLFALYAFNHEIAKTREVVTETQLGLIRLQWWRDALAGYYDSGKVLQHQVMEPLCAAIAAHGLPRESFDNLIYAREFDLEDRAPSSLGGMVKYATYTNAPLAGLALKILGQDATQQDIDSAAAAYGLTGLLRAVPAHLRQRRCYLPEDLLGAAGVSVYDLYDGSGIAKISPVVLRIAQTAEKQIAGVSAAAPRSLRRMAKLSRLYLSQIRRLEGNIFSPSLRVPPLLREIRLMFC